MAVNRTIQFLGQGYAPAGAEPILITATLGGVVVYTGPVPTLYSSIPENPPSPTESVVMFSIEFPSNSTVTLPMTISLDNPVGVTTYWEQVLANYCSTFNPIFTGPQIEILNDPTSTQAEKLVIWEPVAVPPLSESDIATLSTTNPSGTAIRNAVLIGHNLQTWITTGPTGFSWDALEPRSNVVINGTPVSRLPQPEGCWGWVVSFSAPEAGTFSYDLTIPRGLE